MHLTPRGKLDDPVLVSVGLEREDRTRSTLDGKEGRGKEYPQVVRVWLQNGKVRDV